jgi:hypothetical protein
MIICLLFSFTGDENSDKTIFEKVYLHLDRHFYLSGDDIWFKAYLVDAQTGKLSPGSSRILYAELISPESGILQRRVLFVDTDGCAIGDFRIKNSAVSGKYRIRAYSRWMLNFGDVFVFEKEIEVQTLPDGSTVTSASNEKKKRKDNPNEKVITREDVEIEFFPESGSLISGLANIIAFKANDRSGKGANVNGGILNSNSDTVVTFTSEHLGMGKFGFVPHEGESYQAFFIPEGLAYSQYAKLPETSEKGFAMNIIDSDTAYILNIRTNPKTFDDFSGKMVSLVFSRSEKPLFGHGVALNKRSELVLVPKSLLPAGIIRITLYDEQEKPHCERLVYIENKDKVNVNITPANDTVSIVKVTDDRGQPSKAFLSMSITNTTVPDEVFDMESYFWLESEIKGKIERPSAYFDTANHDRFKQIDLLLLTQGWRDFVWKHVEKNIPEFPEHEMERGLKITGHVKKLVGSKPCPNAAVAMFFPDPRADISTYIPDLLQKKGRRFTLTDSLGNYNFGYMNFFGYRMLSLTSRTEKDKPAGEISINPLFMPAEEFPVKVWKQYRFDSICTLPVESYSQKNYRLTDTIVLDPVTISDRKDGHLISDREITPHDDTLWMSLDYYIKGQASTLISASVPTKILNTLKITYYDSNGKKMKSRVPHPSKISMREVDRVRIYKENTFVNASEVPPCDLAIRYSRIIYSVDVYSVHDGFTEQNFPVSKFIREVSEGSRNTATKNEAGYYEEITSINFDSYNPYMPPIRVGNSRGLHTTTVGDVDYSSISPIVGGYYEERKFYSPEFYSHIDMKDYFGTYFWQADIRTDTNGEATVYYNPQKQPSGKIRIEGITNDGIPFVKKINYTSRAIVL